MYESFEEGRADCEEVRRDQIGLNNLSKEMPVHEWVFWTP